MQWEDSGILLSQRLHEENGQILSFLTQKSGKHLGYVRRSSSAKASGGNLGLGGVYHIVWNARLEKQMGTWRLFEIEIPSPLVHVYGNSQKFYALSSALMLTELCLAERDAHPFLYQALYQFLHDDLLQETPEQSWIIGYIAYELILLSDIGFGFDWSSCAVTGVKKGLCYVSPKTGSAVSKIGAGKYVEKLFPLPQFLLALWQSVNHRKRSSDASSEDLMPSNPEIHQALNITSHFLERAVGQSAHSGQSASTRMPQQRVLLGLKFATV